MRVPQHDNTSTKSQQKKRAQQNSPLAQCCIFADLSAMTKVCPHYCAFLFPGKTTSSLMAGTLIPMAGHIFKISIKLNENAHCKIEKTLNTANFVLTCPYILVHLNEITRKINFTCIRCFPGMIEEYCLFSAVSKEAKASHFPT